MRNRIVLVLLMVSCFNCVWAAGSDNFVEIKPKKKVLHVDKLGLGESTPIIQVLSTMPELLGRGSWDSNVMNNFTVRVDFRDVGQSRDLILQQMVIAEVDVIEISTFPTMSENSSGTGGVINIRLKPVVNEGVSGMAMLDASTEWDVAPSVLINYRKDKFTLRSSLRAEYYRPTSYYTSYVGVADSMMQVMDTARLSYKQETAKLFMQYMPTKNDELKVNIWENYGRAQNWSDMSMGSLVQHSQKKAQESLTAEAFMGYKHLYTTHKGEFKIEAYYNYKPKKVDKSLALYDRSVWLPWDSIVSMEQAHKVNGEISDKHVVYKTDADMVDFKYGMTAYYMFGNVYEFSQQDSFVNCNPHSYVSPYLEMNYNHGIWDLQAGLRYQYYRVNFTTNPNLSGYNDSQVLIGNVSLRCNVAEGHNLRLLTGRNVRTKRTQDLMKIYPYYDVDLNYIFDWQNDAHRMTVSASAKYLYASEDVGHTGITVANAQLVYQYGIFSMAFTGNAYVRMPFSDALESQKSWFYNLSVLPVLSLPKQWVLSGQVMYNSKVQFRGDTYGDCVYSQIRLSKQVRGWNVHMELNDIFHYPTVNTMHLQNGMQYTNIENLYNRSISIGFSYTF